MHRLSRLFIALCLSCSASTCFAQLKAKPGEWPGFRGPDRTDISTETGLLKEWPKDGPPLLWKIDGLGEGYSTPSIAQGKIFLMGATKGEESVIALDINDGKQIWSTPIGKSTGGYACPKSTPTVDGELLYSISSDGQLACLETATGTVKWTQDLKKEFGGKSGGWAYSESPLIDGDRVVCTPGGEKATLVGLNKVTGDLVWKAPLDIEGKKDYTTAAYSSIIIAKHGGVKQYVQFLSKGVVGVSAEDGALLWHYDKPANGTANCSTPLFHDGAVFAASNYGTGGGRANIKFEDGKFEAEEAYFVKEIQNHHGGLVLVDEHVYGTGGGTLMCIDYKTGKINWNERGVGKGSVIYADGHLYVRSENGPLALVEATPDGYKETGRFDQPYRSGKEAWQHPVIAGGKLYIRDWDILLCYDVKAKK